MTESIHLNFGYCVPADYVGAAWGARLIYPSDLVYDRQDTQYNGDGDRAVAVKELHDWLNGGVLRSVLDRLDTRELRSNEERELVLYDDERGTVVGNPNGSYGYVYVAAWMKGGA